MEYEISLLSNKKEATSIWACGSCSSKEKVENVKKLFTYLLKNDELGYIIKLKNSKKDATYKLNGLMEVNSTNFSNIIKEVSNQSI